MNKALLIVINLFVCACIFDPADKLLHLKVPLFCFSWFLFIIYLLHSRRDLVIPVGLPLYVLTMICIPLISIAYYFISNGNEPYEGLPLFKSYLFISLTFILYVFRFDLIKSLSAILSILSILIIGVSITVLSLPSLFMPIYNFGMDTGIFGISFRAYNDDIKMFSAFFVTSPMLAVSISHYVYLAMKSNSKNRRLLYSLFAIINIIAMFIAGTRNNMLVSILLPITLIVLYSKRRALTASLFMIFLAIFALNYSDAIQAMISPKEVSNEVKIGLLYDYIKVFTDPIYLLFGQGLGSYFYMNLRGMEFYVTELSFLEVFRNFGIFLGIIMMLLILYPVIYTFYINRSFNYKHIVIGYISYLFMSMTNPHLFSSGGMLIISILIALIFLSESESRRLKISEAQAISK